jgi:hypothetical protein
MDEDEHNVEMNADFSGFLGYMWACADGETGRRPSSAGAAGYHVAQLSDNNPDNNAGRRQRTTKNENLPIIWSRETSVDVGIQRWTG